jgi:RNA polymerase sigma-70 factor, ECF subfamily
MDSDKNLVKKIIDGEPESFKILYLRYSDLLYAYILHSTLNNKTIATDIWQETWCVAVEKIESFQFKSSFLTWLCAIAKNKISDYYRNAVKNGTAIPLEDLPSDIESEETDDESIGPETRAAVIAVLGRLNNEYTYMLRAKYIDNKTTEEIAFETGRSYKATESMLSRAREAFRKQFYKMKN